MARNRAAGTGPVQTGPRVAPRGRVRHQWLFVELLGVLGALDDLVPGGVVLRGLRCSERELAKLFPEEAAALTRATSRADDDASVPEIVHGRCGEGITHEKLPVYVYGQMRPRAARLMVERARGSGDAEVYSCAARVRRVIVPTQWNADQFGHNAVVAAEAVDANLFSPAAAEADASARQAIDALIGHKTTFRVLSIFKWERRKAPDVLIDGFFQAFPDDAELVLHAYQPSWESETKKISNASRKLCGLLAPQRASRGWGACNSVAARSGRSTRRRTASLYRRAAKAGGCPFTRPSRCNYRSSSPVLRARSRLLVVEMARLG